MLVKGSIVNHQKLGKGKVVDILYRDCMAWVRFDNDKKIYAVVIATLEEIDPTENN